MSVSYLKCSERRGSNPRRPAWESEIRYRYLTFTILAHLPTRQVLSAGFGICTGTRFLTCRLHLHAWVDKDSKRLPA